MDPSKRTASCTITDPLGHQIQVPLNLCCNKDGFFNDSDIYDEVSDVIAKPALFIRMESSGELYYYRMIGKDKFVLISATTSNNTWTANKCIKNPCKQYLLDLMQKGKILS